MWELDYKESWALKNWCFWTVVLEKTLKSPLNCKEIQPVNPKGNQCWIILGRTNAEAELQYFGHLMRRADSLEKTLMLGKIEGRRKKGWQRMSWLECITILMDMSLSRLWKLDREAWCAAVHGVTKNRTRLSNWTELNLYGKTIWKRRNIYIYTHTRMYVCITESFCCMPESVNQLYSSVKWKLKENKKHRERKLWYILQHEWTLKTWC